MAETEQETVPEDDLPTGEGEAVEAPEEEMVDNDLDIEKPKKEKKEECEPCEVGRTCLDGNVRRYGYIAYGILRTHFVLRQCQTCPSLSKSPDP